MASPSPRHGPEHGGGVGHGQGQGDAVGDFLHHSSVRPSGGIALLSVPLLAVARTERVTVGRPNTMRTWRQCPSISRERCALWQFCHCAVRVTLRVPGSDTCLADSYKRSGEGGVGGACLESYYVRV